MSKDQIPEELKDLLNTPELQAAYLDTSQVQSADDCIAEEDRPRFLKWRRTQKAVETLSSPIIKLCKFLKHIK